MVDEVARLVLLTEHHRPADDDANGCALCDADLPDAVFTAGRAAVLRALLAKPRLFQTGYGRAAWEDAARANVTRELAGLEGRSLTELDG